MGWYGRRVEVSAKTLTTHHGEVSSLCWRERYVHNYLVSVCLRSVQKRSDIVALSSFFSLPPCERKSILDEPMLDDATQDTPINNRKWTQASDNAIAITGTPNQRSRCAAERLHHRRWRCPSYTTKRRSSSSSEK